MVSVNGNLRHEIGPVLVAWPHQATLRPRCSAWAISTRFRMKVVTSALIVMIILTTYNTVITPFQHQNAEGMTLAHMTLS